MRPVAVLRFRSRPDITSPKLRKFHFADGPDVSDHKGLPIAHSGAYSRPGAPPHGTVAPPVKCIPVNPSLTAKRANRINWAVRIEGPVRSAVTSAIAVRPQPSIRFRGRSFIAFVLAPAPPLPNWLAELEKWSMNSPDFFVGRPIILDLAGVSLTASGIAQLITVLGERGIRIMGIEGVEADQLGPSLPPLLKGGRPSAGGDASEAAPAMRPRKPDRRPPRGARSPLPCCSKARFAPANRSFSLTAM